MSVVSKIWTPSLLKNLLQWVDAADLGLPNEGGVNVWKDKTAHKNDYAASEHVSVEVAARTGQNVLVKIPNEGKLVVVGSAITGPLFKPGTTLQKKEKAGEYLLSQEATGLGPTTALITSTKPSLYVAAGQPGTPAGLPYVNSTSGPNALIAETLAAALTVGETPEFCVTCVMQGYGGKASQAYFQAQKQYPEGESEYRLQIDEQFALYSAIVHGAGNAPNSPKGFKCVVKNEGGEMPAGTYYAVVEAFNRSGGGQPTTELKIEVEPNEAGEGEGILEFSWSPPTEEAGVEPTTSYRVFITGPDGEPETEQQFLLAAPPKGSTLVPTSVTLPGLVETGLRNGVPNFTGEKNTLKASLFDQSTKAGWHVVTARTKEGPATVGVFLEILVDGQPISAVNLSSPIEAASTLFDQVLIGGTRVNYAEIMVQQGAATSAELKTLHRHLMTKYAIPTPNVTTGFRMAPGRIEVLPMQPASRFAKALGYNIGGQIGKPIVYPAAQQGGATSVRYTQGWISTEAVKGKLEIPAASRTAIEEMYRHGLTPVATIAYSPNHTPVLPEPAEGTVWTLAEKVDAKATVLKLTQSVAPFVGLTDPPLLYIRKEATAFIGPPRNLSATPLTTGGTIPPGTYKVCVTASQPKNPASGVPAATSVASNIVTVTIGGTGSGSMNLTWQVPNAPPGEPHAFGVYINVGGSWFVAKFGTWATSVTISSIPTLKKAPKFEEKLSVQQVVKNGRCGGGYGGMVTKVDPVANTITLASGTVSSMQVGEKLIFAKLFYAPMGSLSETDPSNVALAQLAKFVGDELNAIGQSILGHEPEGEVEIWNEPIWPTDPWDDRETFFPNTGTFNIFNGKITEGSPVITEVSDFTLVWKNHRIAGLGQQTYKPTVTTVSGSNIITVSSSEGLKPNLLVSSTGLPAGTYLIKETAVGSLKWEVSASATKSVTEATKIGAAVIVQGTVPAKGASQINLSTNVSVLPGMQIFDAAKSFPAKTYLVKETSPGLWETNQPASSGELTLEKIELVPFEPFLESGIPKGAEVLSYDPVAKTITMTLSATSTRGLRPTEVFIPVTWRKKGPLEYLARRPRTDKIIYNSGATHKTGFGDIVSLETQVYLSGNTVSGSPNITAVPKTVCERLQFGMAVRGFSARGIGEEQTKEIEELAESSGIPVSAYIQSVNPGTGTVTLNVPATKTATGVSLESILFSRRVLEKSIAAQSMHPYGDSPESKNFYTKDQFGDVDINLSGAAQNFDGGQASSVVEALKQSSRESILEHTFRTTITEANYGKAELEKKGIGSSDTLMVRWLMRSYLTWVASFVDRYVVYALFGVGLLPVIQENSTNPELEQKKLEEEQEIEAGAGFPVIYSLNPEETLSLTGGETITVNGINFNGTTAVKFGTIPAKSFTVVSNEILHVQTPAVGSGSQVIIQVTNAKGISKASSVGQFGLGEAVSKYTFRPAYFRLKELVEFFRSVEGTTALTTADIPSDIFYDHEDHLELIPIAGAGKKLILGLYRRTGQFSHWEFPNGPLNAPQPACDFYMRLKPGTVINSVKRFRAAAVDTITPVADLPGFLHLNTITDDPTLVELTLP